MLATERTGIYGAQGIDNIPSRSLRRLYPHPVRDAFNSVSEILSLSGDRLRILAQAAARYPFTTALLSCVIIAGAAEASGVSILPPQRHPVSDQGIVSSDTEPSPIGSVNINLPPYPEMLSETARLLLTNEVLAKHAESLPKGSSAVLEVFDKNAQGIVQPEEGLNVRSLPTERAEKEYPFGLDFRQDFKYSGIVTIEIPQSDGTIHHEEWVVLFGDVGVASDGRVLVAPKPVFAAKEVYDLEEREGKIIPVRKMELLIAGRNESGETQEFKLHRYRQN